MQPIPLHPHSPQRGPARALGQILDEFPHLPALAWSITPGCRTLRGTAMDCADPVGLMAAYADALDGAPWAPLAYLDGRQHRTTQFMFVTWRGVEIVIAAGGDTDADVTLLAEVAA